MLASWRDTLIPVEPETVITVSSAHAGWHRKGWRYYWHRKSQRGKSGRPPIDPEIMSKNHAARHYDVGETTIRRLVEAVILPMTQVVPWAPWEIKRSDLESEQIKRIVDTLHKTGKVQLSGHRLADHPTLPFTKYGDKHARHCS